MPVYELEWFHPAERGDYPHMAKHDARIWERFLAEFGGNFVRFAYDVALGGFLPRGDPDTLEQRQGFQYSTALKVDVAGERPDDVWIIEVKPNASVSAVGAALCYLELAKVDRFTSKPLFPAIVTDTASRDIRTVCDALGVVLVELDRTPGGELAPAAPAEERRANA